MRPEQWELEPHKVESLTFDEIEQEITRRCGYRPRPAELRAALKTWGDELRRVK